MLGTSDTWSTIHSSQRTSVLYCRSSDFREREGRGGLPATFKLSFEHEKWILDGCPTGRKALLAPYSSELSAGACVCHKMARNHHPSLLVLAFRLFFMGINLYLTSCFRFTTTTIPSCWSRPATSSSVLSVRRACQNHHFL